MIAWTLFGITCVGLVLILAWRQSQMQLADCSGDQIDALVLQNVKLTERCANLEQQIEEFRKCMADVHEAIDDVLDALEAVCECDEYDDEDDHAN